MIKNSKAESGNLVYTLHQNTENASEFMAYEEYICEEAFNNHCKTEYIQAFFEQVKPLLDADITIQVF